MADIKGKLRDLMSTTFGGSSSQEFHDLSRLNHTTHSHSGSQDLVLNLSYEKLKSPKGSKRKLLISQEKFSPQSHLSKPSQMDSDLQLKYPSTFTTNISSGSTKIKREINCLQRIISKDGIQKGGFRNRPALNLNRPELIFSWREYLACSPVAMKRHSLASGVMKNYKKSGSDIMSFKFQGKPMYESPDEFASDLAWHKMNYIPDKNVHRKKF